jgi:lipopolysaccharide/colanic/teichoic acid biosynthesis glycosyltransferase
MSISTESYQSLQETSFSSAGSDTAVCSAHRVFPRNPGYLPVKVTAEWLLALMLVIATAPLGLFLAVLVKLTSRGPVFYAQTRLGMNSKIFRMFKFRTMVNNAESRTGPVWCATNDSRITSVGKVLRMTHLDELPQLWNVLRGEMSLIGPRPERPELAARISRQVPDFRQRLAIRPGITGLAQLLLPADNPNDTEMLCVRRKLAHDVAYIRGLGLTMDLRIALGTPCYFVAAAIGAVQHKLVQRYGVGDQTELNVHESTTPSNAISTTSDTTEMAESVR